ncbi:MAG TPA: nuclear transport factor 2 family protein, partial [Candidatus Dormibacteraeota bacterium]
MARLFSEDATYRYHPFDEPIRGRLAIVASWVGDKDTPGTYDASYRTLAVDGDLAVASGRSRYYTDASKSTLEAEYDNLFLMRFDQEGRCLSFQEWYMTPRG